MPFICLVSLVLDIKLNTLTFKSFITSGIHIFVYGLSILLQLPLHLLVLILKLQNTGSLLLKLIISGLILHSWFFIEMQFKEVVLTKLDKHKDPI